MDTKKRC